MNYYDEFEEEYDQNYEFNSCLNKLIDFEVEKRIKENDLENRISYFENKIEHLNDKIISKTKEINELEVENTNLGKELEKLESEQNKKAEDLLKEKLKGYTTGEHVYLAAIEKIFSKKVACDKCDKTGKIKAIIKGKEENIKCPKCEGKGYLYKQGEWIKYFCTKIKVYFLITSNLEIKACYKNYDFPETVKTPFFKTREECEKYCNEENRKNGMLEREEND